MIRARIAKVLLAAALAFGLAAAAPGSDPAPSGERRILVMISLPPPHFKPGRGYSGSYGDVQSAAARRRVARRIARENALQLEESWPMPLLGVDCYVMRLPEGASAEEAVSKVSRHALVSWSQPMQVFETRQSGEGPSDPLFRAMPAATSWRLADLHRVATGRGARIAVIDSRIEVGHPDLAGQFSAVRDFVGGGTGAAEQHGTAIAGVIAAKANGVGTVGIAPNARLMALRACWQAGPTGRTLCNSLSLARALQFAIENGAGVINLSLSGPHDPLLQKLVALAIARRASVVAAFDPQLARGGFPASQPGVIAVADEALQPLPPRLYGAPGRNVPAARPGGKWDLVSGNSYAAAHVSGLVALALERRCPRSAPMVIARSAGGGIDACATLLRMRACGARSARPADCR